MAEFDIKAKAEEIAGKIQKDPAMLADFKKDPVKTVEKLAGVSLPAGVGDKLAALVKTKMTADSAAGALGSLKKLF